MSLSKFSALKELSESEVREQIIATKKELFDLRLKKATRQLEKPHLFTHAKHKLAQLMTLAAQRSSSNG
jgi:large subunit ribosomal protein L29